MLPCAFRRCRSHPQTVGALLAFDPRAAGAGYATGSLVQLLMHHLCIDPEESVSPSLGLSLCCRLALLTDSGVRVHAFRSAIRFFALTSWFVVYLLRTQYSSTSIVADFLLGMAYSNPAALASASSSPASAASADASEEKKGYGKEAKAAASPPSSAEQRTPRTGRGARSAQQQSQRGSRRSEAREQDAAAAAGAGDSSSSSDSDAEMDAGGGSGTKRRGSQRGGSKRASGSGAGSSSGAQTDALSSASSPAAKVIAEVSAFVYRIVMAGGTPSALGGRSLRAVRVPRSKKAVARAMRTLAQLKAKQVHDLLSC